MKSLQGIQEQIINILDRKSPPSYSCNCYRYNTGVGWRLEKILKRRLECLNKGEKEDDNEIKKSENGIKLPKNNIGY